jgi:hypothetical protein
LYINSLQNAALNNNYKDVDFYLNGVKKYQRKFGVQVMPSEEKITAEIIYNKYDIFKKLFYL